MTIWLKNKPALKILINLKLLVKCSCFRVICWQCIWSYGLVKWIKWKLTVVQNSIAAIKSFRAKCFESWNRMQWLWLWIYGFNHSNAQYLCCRQLPSIFIRNPFSHHKAVSSDCTFTKEILTMKSRLACGMRNAFLPIKWWILEN